MVELTYSLERIDRFRDPCAGLSFKTLLLCLASISSPCKIVEYLLSQGTSLEDIAALECIERWRGRTTPLQYSVKGRHKTIARLLLSYDIDADSQVYHEKLTLFKKVISRHLTSNA